MGLTYLKRLRMHTSIPAQAALPRLPSGYRWAPWTPDLLEAHARVKHQSFLEEMDAAIFPCLATLEGCRDLMVAITGREGFVPGATWLIERVSVDGPATPCGTIQGVRVGPREGGIQNVGVTPVHRGRGLGAALVGAALVGFQQAGLTRACLEVTAQNDVAVRLYRRLGFQSAKVHYRPLRPEPLAAR